MLWVVMTHEDHLIRDDRVRQEIDEIITEVFGEEMMGQLTISQHRTHSQVTLRPRVIVALLYLT